jgi:hypothetical protein
MPDLAQRCAQNPILSPVDISPSHPDMVLGHVASFCQGRDRHYYPMAFAFDPVTGATTRPVVLARRSDFPDGPAKPPDLVDVLFSGGLLRLGDGRARLYVGISDATAGWVEIADPFACPKLERQLETSSR